MNENTDPHEPIGRFHMVVKTDRQGRETFMFEYAAVLRVSCGRKVMAVARAEGYYGTLTCLLEFQGYEIRQFEFRSVRERDDAELDQLASETKQQHDARHD